MIYLLLDIINGEIYDYEISGPDFKSALIHTLKIDPDYFGLKYLNLNKEENINTHLDEIKKMYIYKIDFKTKKVTRFTI